MKTIICFAVLQVCGYVTSEIRESVIVNKLTKVKPVGSHVANRFVPLTEIPPPHVPHSHSGRRHLEDDCSSKPDPRQVYEGAKVELFGEYYDEKVAKTVATVVIPDHIDRKHFEVTTQVPYLTVGPIEAMGYHPSTKKSDECEKIYQDHIEEQYSDETTDYSEESLEMARMPLFPDHYHPPREDAEKFEKMYSDIEI